MDDYDDLADHVPAVTSVEEPGRGGGGAAEDVAAMRDEWYIDAHESEVAAAATRSVWAHDGVWDGWAQPFNGREGIDDMQAEVTKMLETGEGLNPVGGAGARGKGKGKGKGKGATIKKKVSETAAIALEALDRARRHVTGRQDALRTVCRSDARAGHACRCFWSCDSVCMKHGTPCPHGAPSLSVAFPKFAVGGPRGSADASGGIDRRVGVSFNGTVLTDTRRAECAMYVGHRIQSVNGVLVRSAADVAAAFARALAAPAVLELRLVFHPRYLAHEAVRTLGRSVLPTPLPQPRWHILNGCIATHYLFPDVAQVGWFGSGLVFQNIAAPGSWVLLRVVRADRAHAPAATVDPRNAAGAFKRRRIWGGTADMSNGHPLSQEELSSSSLPVAYEGFTRDRLRTLYPSPFAPFSDGTVHGSAKCTRNPGLARCQRAFRRFVETKSADAQFYLFIRPVDPVADEAPGYDKLIKHPMDLGTIAAWLDNDLYSDETEVKRDMQKVWDNCRIFNPVEHALHEYATKLETHWRLLLAEEEKKRTWHARQADRKHSAQQDALGKALIAHVAALPPFSPALEEVVTKLSAVKGACRWATTPSADSPDHLDVVLTVVPEFLTTELGEAVASLEEVRQAQGTGVGKKRKHA
eukprot:TRINITY_DN4370_c0_g2_i1.p1 TRINITY_DN4370_c0_g2~~TRINITY_DN4370_c0_g2_i1.p1  ORF type:complete len:639 (+),score=156.24 TRINITY_DN4370_c0_g2_i1:79-1995(+)